MIKGIFGGLFDFNNDGKLSCAEQAAELAFLDELLHQERDSAADADYECLDDD